MPQACPVILIADDDQAIRDLLRELLQQEGYAVECLADGNAVLARVQTGGVGLVLLDLKLPGLDGRELCQRVRTHERESGGHVPIIMLTASADAGQHEASLAAGADDYLRKPFDLQELLEHVQRAVPER